MTPYLINRTWIDLDHVLAIEEYGSRPGYFDNMGHMHLAFRNEPFEISIDDQYPPHPWREPDVFKRDCIVKWVALIAAWKANRSLRDL